MSKRKYKMTKIQDLNFNSLRQVFENRKLVLATDVAKKKMVTALSDKEGNVEALVAWENPNELDLLLSITEQLAPAKVELVLEPTGTYGEPLRHLGLNQGWHVFLLSPKRVNDAKELYDGVPSLHDAKAATLIAKLHADGLSNMWGVQTHAKRELSALVKTVVNYGRNKRNHMNRLEAELARFWPEVGELLKLDSVTLLTLLTEFGGPESIAKRPKVARKTMRKAGGNGLKTAKIEALLEAAKNTHGQSMIAVEREALAELARHTLYLRRQHAIWERRLKKEAQTLEDVAAMGEVVGLVTASVLRSEIGDLRDFPSPEAAIKMAGLNLKEKSSGNHKGQLKLTKRGSSIARSYLYWAALRKINSDSVFKAWHKKKVDRDGGRGRKSVIALMRKLVKALWHVARGKPFDSHKLFDVTRLNLT